MFEYMIVGLLILFFLTLVVVGLSASRHLNYLEDYFLGGRKLTPFVLAFTFSATGMSGWLALGFAGYTYEYGFQSLWIMVPSTTLGIYLCFKYVSKRVRMYSEMIGAISIIEVIKKRFYDDDNILSTITVIMVCTAAIAYVSGQLIAAGKLLNIILGWNYEISICISVVVVIIYTVLGGFVAICWTDVLQGLFMLVGSVLAGTIALVYANGPAQLFTKAVEVHQHYPSFEITPFSEFSMVLMGVSLFIGDGIFNWIGQPTLMVKYMASKNVDILKKASRYTIIIQTLLFSGIFLAAIFMRTQFPNPSSLPFSGDSETVIIQFFILLTHPIIVGIIIASIISAIMSTSDSLLMMASSVLVNNTYLLFKPKTSQKHLIQVSRLIVVLLGLISVFIALNRNSVLWSAWFGWTTLGIVGIPLVIGLYWSNTTREGAIWGMISGFSVLVIWNIFNITAYINLFYALPAGVTTLIITIWISLNTPKPPDHVIFTINELKKTNQHVTKLKI